MNGALPMTKQFIIEMDMVNGTVDYKNPDGLSYFEAVGMIEYSKMMITREFLNETEE